MQRTSTLLNSLIVFLACVALSRGSLGEKSESRVIGGKESDIASNPYVVSIRHRIRGSSAYWHMCAGSIYSPTVIITGAQCFFNIAAADRVMIVAGANTRTGVDGQLYPAKKWVIHPDWDARTVDYDIAILILEVPLNLHHPYVKAIQIRGQRPANGRYAKVAGWGYREEYGPSSYRLEQAQVPIVSTEDCTKAYGVGEVTERMICAGFINSGGVDACQGDTGGPLVYNGELVGLVSWGRGCARPGYPGVYTFMGSFKKWVDETIAANE